jgi:multiple antibiotic resistance protein
VHPSRVVLPVALASLSAALLFNNALAQSGTDTPPASGWNLTPGQIWTFFFLLLGPIKIIAPFVGLTHGADADFVRRLALRAAGFAATVLFVAALVGVRMLDKFNMNPSVLTLAGGIVVFLVALRSLLDQIAGTAPPPPAAGAMGPALQSAFSPLAFPIIVTPSGIAAVIVFMALAPDWDAKLVIIALLVLVLTLDLCAMLFARFILRWAAMPLQVFGAVLGIIQLALGLHIILAALHNLAVIAYRTQ